MADHLGNDSINKTKATVIKPGKLGFLATISEIRRYYELFYFLFWRDISVRYKQTVFGVLWIILQPLISTSLFVFIRFLLRPSTQSVFQDFVFVLCGIVTWMFFAGSVRRASGSLVGNSALITKVYFPRIIIPIAAVFGSFIDFIIGIMVAAGFIIYGLLKTNIEINTGLPVLALPAFVILSLVLSVGISLFFGAVNIRFRDVGFILGYLLQTGMHASAVWWSLDDAVTKFQTYGKLIMLNPMVGLMEGYRWCLIGSPFPAVPLLITCGFTLIVFMIGYSYFMSVERTFADVI